MTPHDESKMTNKERAEKLKTDLKHFLPFGCNFAPAHFGDDVDLIERALDETAKRAMEAGINAGYKTGKIEGQKEAWDKIEEIIKKRISEAVDKAGIAAQKDMRERAALAPEKMIGKYCQENHQHGQFCEDYGCTTIKNIAGLIRSLPIEGSND